MRTRILHASLIGALVLLVLLVFSDVVSAQVRQSTNYRIQSDSINTGGVLSTSTTYILEDTTGEIATGELSSASYEIRAGYQQMQEVYLALTGAVNVPLAPDIGGITGGTSDGSVTLTATTDNRAGYQLKIRASNSPAMQSGANSIDDYAPVGAVPDFLFTTDATDSQLGFSPEGDDIVDRFRDAASACNQNGGGDTALRCWDGLSTTDAVIASAAGGNHPEGTDTTIRFRVGIGSSAFQSEGTYTATTTVTLIAL